MTRPRAAIGRSKGGSCPGAGRAEVRRGARRLPPRRPLPRLAKPAPAALFSGVRCGLGDASPDLEPARRGAGGARRGPGLRALLVGLALATAAGPPAATRAGEGHEVVAGTFVATTRALLDWKAYLTGDLRELVSHAETTTVFEPAAEPPREASGLDLAAASPVRSRTVTRTVVRPGDPEFGTLRMETSGRTATGERFELHFTLRGEGFMKPARVGPMEGPEIRTPLREQRVDGRTVRVGAVSRTVEVQALLVASSLEDLLAGRGLHEVRAPGAHVSAGSLRVLSKDGQVMGLYAGDLRLTRGRVIVLAGP